MRGMQATRKISLEYRASSQMIWENTIILSFQGIPENLQKDSGEYSRRFRGI